MKLAESLGGRNNNLNLIRLIAAYGVLVSHSFPLALGRGAIEPPGASLGMSLGSICVDIFFFISGFLVTGSLLARQSTTQFLWARALRIYPALLVMLVLTVGGLGLFISPLPVADFFSSPVTAKYFLYCLTLINDVRYELPGVFVDNPYSGAVNGSLWTMPYEVRLYLILALAWAAYRMTGPRRAALFRLTVAFGTLGFGFLYFSGRLGAAGSSSPFFHLAFMFMSGASYFFLRKHIVLSGRIALALAVALVAAAYAGHDVFFVVYSLCIGYLLLYLAYVPAGFIRRYNRFGDYSYGVYIYAFPVQQTVAALNPGIGVLEMVLVASLFTLMLAILSWHFVEERALSFKHVSLRKPSRLMAAEG
ncbi:MAG TPA: acyltransferase [Moraxellaceae bacterium]